MTTGGRFAGLARRFRETPPWAFDAFLGTAFTVLGLVGLKATRSSTVDYHPADALGVVLALACSLPYYLRRRAPATVLIVNVVALCAMSIIGYPSDVQAQMILVGMYTVGAHGIGGGRVLGPLAVGIGLTTVAIAGIPGATTTNLLFTGAVYAGGFLFGSTVRNRRLYLGELEARAVAAAQERDEEAKRALADERLRIAQELHDVVAHSMGVIAVQAGVGAHVIDRDPDEAKRSLEAIAGTSRSTLHEIRRILGVLRGDGGAAYQPAPGLADLDRLVADFDDAGLPVTVTVDGEPDALPAGVDLTAYRIVQEALTNTLKHAGPARAEVTVSYRPGAVALCITDDGRGVNGTASEGGHGLLGMRERVGVYGGSLTVGPQRGGGFRVLAALPYGVDE
jgi:signal transduction histidine kinase